MDRSNCEGSGRLVTIVKLRPAKAGLIATLEGVERQNAAEALKGVKLYVAQKPAAGAGAGRPAITPISSGSRSRPRTARCSGRVDGIADYGAGDLLDIEVAGGAETLLVPLAGAAVDLAARQDHGRSAGGLSRRRVSGHELQSHRAHALSGDVPGAARRVAGRQGAGRPACGRSTSATSGTGRRTATAASTTGRPAGVREW